MAGVNAYKDGVVSRLFKGLTGLIKGRGITVIEGEGRLTGPRTVEVDGTPLRRQARGAGLRLLLALAARPRGRRRAGAHLRARAAARPGAGLGGRARRRRDRLRVRQRLALASAPRSPSSRRCPGWSPPRTRRPPRRSSAPSASAGSRFRTGTPFQSRQAHRRPASRVTVEGGDVIEAELLLVAVGRGPTTDGLGYDEQGVAMDRGFVLTDERCRTNLEGVYAVGDIVPGLQLAHRGFQQGIFVAEEIAGLDPHADRRGRHPAGHLLRPRGRLGRPRRGAGRASDVRRRRGRDRSPTTSAATARARSSRPRASSSWSAARTARSSASTWSATASASSSARPS